MSDFVSFKLAQKLKEKGFREECLCHYVGKDLVYNIESPIANNQFWFSHNKYDNLWHRDNIDAPTISQVLKWLREEKNIVFGIAPMQEMDGDYLSWCITILKVADDGYGLSFKEELYYDSYESTVLAGIEYVLDNLI